MLTLYEPRGPLNRFVERMWLVTDGHAPRQESILPSGTVELVVNLAEDRIRIDGTAHGAPARTLPGIAVSGTYSEAFLIDGRQHAAMVGVHFRPGGGAAVLGVPCSEFADAHLELAALWGDGVARELRDRLCAATRPRDRFRCLEEALTRRLRSSVPPHPVVSFALERFTSTGLGAPVHDVARAFGLSHRRFLTVFEREVGLAPKLFCRILRFRYLHALAERTRRIDWAQLALQCGFCDQSHLTNEFRKLAGLTPTEYEARLRCAPDVLDGHVVVS